MNEYKNVGCIVDIIEIFSNLYFSVFSYRSYIKFVSNLD